MTRPPERLFHGFAQVLLSFYTYTLQQETKHLVPCMVGETPVLLPDVGPVLFTLGMQQQCIELGHVGKLILHVDNTHATPNSAWGNLWQELTTHY